MNVLDFITRYEADQLDNEEIIEGFQELIDTGIAWRLQGSYGRMASRLIQEGVCHPATDA